MKLAIILMATVAVLSLGRAADTAPAGGAEEFVRQVVQTYLDEENKVTFKVADRVFAIDNGEVLTKADLQKAWPQFAKQAFKKQVSLDQFFKDAELLLSSPRDNKRLMSNQRVLEAYKYQDGDLYCDASHMKEGTENLIAYDKAFIFIIRQVEGKWTLIGIGG
ncbi:MAG: hypothetical protein K8R87_06435 [Verrucomicrobia bacterium]|nr:hypothetical protein [Verrucomicrobiota bacterium]